MMREKTEYSRVHAWPEGRRTGTLGSLKLRRLVSLAADDCESVDASKRLAWMLLGDVDSWACMALDFHVHSKICNGYVDLTAIRNLWAYCIIVCVQVLFWRSSRNVEAREPSGMNSMYGSPTRCLFSFVSHGCDTRVMVTPSVSRTHVEGTRRWK
jgi:hypothetical protein